MLSVVAGARDLRCDGRSGVLLTTQPSALKALSCESLGNTCEVVWMGFLPTQAPVTSGLCPDALGPLPDIHIGSYSVAPL